jgi:Tfp pilus assembly protein PilV
MSAIRDESGFTLIEMLVTILMGIVILSALVTIMVTTLDQTTRYFSKIDATQHARVGVEQIENELHSACVTDNVTPVLTGSTGTTLQFVSQYGTAASLTPVEHVISWNSSTGALTDTTYAETGVTINSSGVPIYTFSTTPSNTRTVLTNVTETGTTPIFEYFKYQVPTNSSNQPYTAPDGNDYEMLIDGTNAIPGTSTVPAAQPLTTPLASSDAALTAEVMINMTVGPSGGTGENTHLTPGDAADAVSDGVVLRLTPAANEAGNGAVFLPCQ